MSGCAKTLFESVDTDKNGSISLEEYVTAFKTLPAFKGHTQVQLEELFKKHDENGDGQLSLDEFTKLHASH